MSKDATTPEQFDLIESKLASLALADVESTRQRATCERLTQQAAAWLLSTSARGLRDRDAPRNTDGSYNAALLVQWQVDRVANQLRDLTPEESDAMREFAERQAAARTTTLEEQAKAVQGQYVERVSVLREFQELASAIRGELERLAKTMANDFPLEHRDRLTDELRNQCKQILRRLAQRGKRIESVSR